MHRLAGAVIGLCMLAATTAAAQDAPTPVATYRDWNVFTVNDGSSLVCFAATEATDKSPKTVRHGDIFFLVSSWKSGAATNQPSFTAGYTLKDGSKPRLRVGDATFRMFAAQNEGFIEDESDETRLVASMRKGAVMNVEAVSARGTSTRYQFSLLGISAALDRVAKECG